MTRPCFAEIRLGALAHNLAQAKAQAANSQHMAVIKANGYGHGIVNAARGLHAADSFAVACLEEAVTLRDAGVTQPILLLEGVFEPAELALVEQYQVTLVVHDENQIDLLTSAKPKTPYPVWLKVNTGMNRLGVPSSQFKSAYRRLTDSESIKSNFVLMTHMACADEPDHEANQMQINLFTKLTADLPNPKSLANSASLLNWPEQHYDWCRPGIMLYGIAPIVDKVNKDFNLKPVMHLESQVISLRQCQAGDHVGYGASYRCDKPMLVAVVAIGYGDGYPRHAPSGTPVLVNGQRAKLVGRVSMDMITIDVSHLDNVQLGAAVVLWGEGLPIEEIANHAGTIGYELVCQVTPRVPKRVID